MIGHRGNAAMKAVFRGKDSPTFYRPLLDLERDIEHC
jgi:hypothetical protein